MNKFLKREGWYLFGILDMAMSFWFGWFIWQWVPWFRDFYKTPEILGFTFCFLNVVREISKLKHPVP